MILYYSYLSPQRFKNTNEILHALEQKGISLSLRIYYGPVSYTHLTGADGKACAKRTPVYPAEWQNQFGLPVTEHQKQLQINIFNGFTVFGLKEDKISTSPQTPSGAEVHNP